MLGVELPGGRIADPKGEVVETPRDAGAVFADEDVVEGVDRVSLDEDGGFVGAARGNDAEGRVEQGGVGLADGERAVGKKLVGNHVGGGGGGADEDAQRVVEAGHGIDEDLAGDGGRDRASAIRPVGDDIELDEVGVGVDERLAVVPEDGGELVLQRKEGGDLALVGKLETGSIPAIRVEHVGDAALALEEDHAASGDGNGTVDGLAIALDDLDDLDPGAAVHDSTDKDDVAVVGGDEDGVGSSAAEAAEADGGSDVVDGAGHGVGGEGRSGLGDRGPRGGGGVDGDEGELVGAGHEADAHEAVVLIADVAGELGAGRKGGAEGAADVTTVVVEEDEDGGPGGVPDRAGLAAAGGRRIEVL